MKKYRHKKAVTLFELLVAISLLSLIVLGFSSIELFSRYQVTSSDRRTQLQNEAAFAIEHMTNSIRQGIGNSTDSPWAGYVDNRGFRIREDDNPANGQIDPTDTWVAYRHTGSQILFFPNATTNDPPIGPSEVIANHIVITINALSGLPNPPADPWGLIVNIFPNNQVEITVRARWDPNPATPVSPDNPEVTLITNVIAPSVSIN